MTIHETITEMQAVNSRIVSLATATNAENAALRARVCELERALLAIVNLDDGDAPDLWHYEKEFNDARAILGKA